MSEEGNASVTKASPNTGRSTRRLLITGANGMIGHALRAAAYERGWTAIPVQRPIREKQDGQRAPASSGTILWEPEAAQPFADLEALEGCDAAIHLAGANLAGQRWTAAYRKQIVESRTLTTSALALALARLRTPPPLLVTASATGYYGSRGEEELTEESSPGVGFLSEVCQAWENAASPALAAGMRVVHLRFGVVLTPFGGALQQMLPLFRLGLGGRLGSGRQWMSWIALADLIDATFHCMEQPELSGPVNIVSPTPVRNQRFTRALGHAVRRPALLPVPAFALRTMFGDMADEALLASCRALPTKLQATGFQFRMTEIEGALNTILANAG